MTKQKFKGELSFCKNDKPCVIMKDNKIVGKGYWMKSTGAMFRVKFKSEAAYKYAKLISNISYGKVKIFGHIINDTIFVRESAFPPNVEAKRSRLHKIRIAKEYENNSNQIMTGYHRSGDKTLSSAIKEVQLLVNKKED